MKFVPVPGTKILMCTTETTVAQYQAAGMGYQAPGFPQGSNHPAVNVSWNDANAWCAWLSKVEGRNYRLPTETEWSAAVGSSTYPWGNQWPPPDNAGNYPGQEMRQATEEEREAMKKGGLSKFGLIGGFRDQHKFTAPVASYARNSNGLYDMGGNVWECCQEWHPEHRGLSRVMRGASWDSVNFREEFKSQGRNSNDPSFRSYVQGFRVVME